MNRGFWRFVWGPAPQTIGGVVLVWQSLLDAEQRSALGIGAVAVFVIVHAVIAFLREQSLPRKVSERNARIVRKLLHLLATLGAISGGNHDLWKLDLYVDKGGLCSLRRRPGLIGKRLVRGITVSLVSTAPLPDDPDMLLQGPVGMCYRDMRALLWLPESLGASFAGNISVDLNPEVNSHLASRYGAMRTFPVTDAADRVCAGVLVVHVEPAHGVQLAGTLSQDQAAIRIREISLDLFEILEGR